MAVPPVIEISSSPSLPIRQESTSHRLPTVSASQALLGLQDKGSSFVLTGLKALDGVLSGFNDDFSGGIERGKVTELWGPAGAGKTGIALQAAANVLNSGFAVVWVDAATPLSVGRWQSISSSLTSGSSHPSIEDRLKGFKRITVPTLSHLLAMVLHPPSSTFQENCGILVVDGVNALIDLDYPRYNFTISNKSEQQKWQASRRYAVLGSLVSALNKVAVLNNLAVIVTTGCSTRMRPDNGLGAALVPGVGGSEWDIGIWNRLVVFRDFSGRFVGVQKCRGQSLISREEVGETGQICPFDIGSDGSICERTSSKPSDQQKKFRASPVKPRKRNFDEIADSEGEEVDEYGWAGTDDDAIAAEGLVDGGRTGEQEESGLAIRT